MTLLSDKTTGNGRISYIEARSCKHRCRRKAISITYSECVSVALVVQHAKTMRPIMLSLASPALPHFSTLSHRRDRDRWRALVNAVMNLGFHKMWGIS
jgi:hypothetical protein